MAVDLLIYDLRNLRRNCLVGVAVFGTARAGIIVATGVAGAGAGAGLVVAGVAVGIAGTFFGLEHLAMLGVVFAVVDHFATSAWVTQLLSLLRPARYRTFTNPDLFGINMNILSRLTLIEIEILL